MKRFYCTICKKVKRVRVLPLGVNDSQSKVILRTGECKHHTAIHVTKTRPVYVKKHKMAASTVKSKSKRG